MSLITISQDKCIKCGLCVNECPENVLNFGKNGPEEICPENCIACGHCVAICPREAIDNKKTPLTNQISSKAFPKLSSEEAKNFLRSRRSIRSYKETTVPKEKLIELVNIAHFAPTGSNLQGISYVIVDDRNILDKAIKLTIEKLANDELLTKRFHHYIESYNSKGIDTVLRGAPCLILATADADFTRGRENSIFSLAYLELYAPTLGLGSCWAGVFEKIALNDDSPMLELFNIPKGQKITGAVMIGYPKYNFPRLIDRNPLEVTFYQSRI
ncbi:nitroreductase family protein [Clostridium gasigenes]|uniref:nitroreductase family protein n=1 Tax=Clostridium gasigenes TaxID=94869 RepID=UPI001C0B69F9|nr:nitroreductase family protein [Clostridium gasigenes]MBU3106998.1 nitroreductase family protein [Clostridium gasigenes]